MRSLRLRNNNTFPKMTQALKGICYEGGELFELALNHIHTSLLKTMVCSAPHDKFAHINATLRPLGNEKHHFLSSVLFPPNHRSVMTDSENRVGFAWAPILKPGMPLAIFIENCKSDWNHRVYFPRKLYLTRLELILTEMRDHCWRAPGQGWVYSYF